MAYVLSGLVGLIVVPGTIVAISYAAAKAAPRGLGIPDFRLLTSGAPGTRSKRFGVRIASSAAALLVCLALAFVAAQELGRAEPTMTVRVLEGPAKRAGIEAAILTVIASYTWPVVLAFHVVDALLPSLRRWGG